MCIRDSTNDIQQIQMLTVMMLRLVIYAPILGLGGVFKVFHTNVSMSWIIALEMCIRDRADLSTRGPGWTGRW